MANPPTIAAVTFLLLSFLFTIRVTSYTPSEHYAVNCGSYGEFSTPDNRTWEGDIRSKLFSLIESQPGRPSVIVNASTNAALNHPYKTARLSRSEFTYSFPVNIGQKFIRLFFFPSSYDGGFNRYDSLFSVKVGNHTLLYNFNPSLFSDYIHEDTFFREYCVNVEPGQRLNVTFTPSRSHPDAYAFVNGIEVISMPTYLYYTSSDDQESMQLNGENQQFPVTTSMALETAYRISVAGSQIPAERDTGMFRSWDNDDQYVEAKHQKSESSGFGLTIKYKDGLDYIAPEEVYKHARSYGMNETSKYNVTWNFEVDPEFTYMMRLHFCEFDQQVQFAGQRVFQIFIADTLVEGYADVIIWSGGNLVPVHRDYAVKMEDRSLKNLSIKLRPHPNPKVSNSDDVILNGIEIFKISDVANGSLASPNPDPRLIPNSPPFMMPSKNSKKTRFIIFIVVGVASGFVVLSLIVFLIFRRLTRGPVNEGSSRWGQKSVAMSKSSKTHRTSLPSDLCRCFSIAEIKAATNNFDDIFIVGVGGFGNVYKGYIDDGTVPVAIKRLKQGSQQGAHEFQTEIEMLSQLRHLHLVSLIGYCNDGNEMILVYEFMARGTLSDHLYNSENQPFSWKKRLEMCLGAARGLNYLHTGANHSIIHRDVKTTNILVDEKWVAKVSDFGLSKIGPMGMSRSHISTVVKGSLGYVDPEYYKRQRLTHKSDVYSFGVVLLEVLCGRPPLLRTVEKQKASLVGWVRKCHHEGVVHQTVDPVLIESITSECLKSFSDMALKCLEDDSNERPSMSDVVWGLEFALELQESAEKTELDRTQMKEKSEEIGMLVKRREEEESEAVFTSSDATRSESKSSKVTTSSSEEHSLVSGIIFSELNNPTLR